VSGEGGAPAAGCRPGEGTTSGDAAWAHGVIERLGFGNGGRAGTAGGSGSKVGSLPPVVGLSGALLQHRRRRHRAVAGCQGNAGKNRPARVPSAGNSGRAEFRPQHETAAAAPNTISDNRWAVNISRRARTLDDFQQQQQRPTATKCRSASPAFRARPSASLISASSNFTPGIRKR